MPTYAHQCEAGYKLDGRTQALLRRVSNSTHCPKALEYKYCISYLTGRGKKLAAFLITGRDRMHNNPKLYFTWMKQQQFQFLACVCSLLVSICFVCCLLVLRTNLWFFIVLKNIANTLKRIITSRVQNAELAPSFQPLLYSLQKGSKGLCERVRIRSHLVVIKEASFLQHRWENFNWNMRSAILNHPGQPFHI